ncbi:nuclear transport factor 2 family protein [Streptomyces sp. A1136]|uniref:nuclear transport factor 2 family protein n=1 Tax=Streptomyces sp. A1136 TaxID=2563102 RepID=UPI00109E5B27|nr:nuclear transport factor 2 family protein [Streptomyces sp. A1136]THA57603.1 nuclear transport factor 2 family protein [Streptomyces sp. A1136]
MTTADRFRSAVDSRDLASLGELFTEDVRLNSPVKFAPFEGKAMVLALFGVLLRTFEDFRYVGRLDGTAEAGAPETAATPTEAAEAAESAEDPASVLVFRATVNGKQIHGIDLLHLDADERIKGITVMVRPQSAVQALGEAVLAGLVADGLVPTS